MDFISWIVVGAIAGFIAGKLMGSSDGLIMMVGLGIVGALVGGFAAKNIFKMGAVDGINVESIFIATLGAVVVIFVARALNRSGRLGRAG